MTSCGADLLANTLLPVLLDGKSFPVTPVTLSGAEYAVPAASGANYAAITKLTNAEITAKTVNGAGTFDTIMGGVAVHLRAEYDAGRITGAEYTKTYIALTEAALGNAVQFVLGREQAYWQAVTAQLQARTVEVAVVTARIQLQVAKAQLQAASYEALNNESLYALTKLKLATEDVAYCTAKFNLENILPKQADQLTAQNAGLGIENSTKTYNLTNMLPKQLEVLTGQAAQQEAETAIAEFNLSDMLPQQLLLLMGQASGQDIQNDTATYQLANILPKNLEMLTAQVAQQEAETAIAEFNLSDMMPGQLAKLNAEIETLGFQNDTLDYTLTNILPKQAQLVTEQAESQRAQTSDTRLDGTTAVVGVLGKQKELYAQQVTSYQRDSEVKAAKIFTDAWITNKTIDEGLTVPDGFTNTSLDEILTAIKTNNNLD